MAASDEFPRGWTLVSSPGAGGLASATAPGLPGITHVLDSFLAKVSSSLTTTQLQWQIFLSSSDGIFVNGPIGLLSAAQSSAPSNLQTDVVEGSNLQFAAGPGASMTVAFQFTAAAVIPYLQIRGHDV